MWQITTTNAVFMKNNFVIFKLIGKWLIFSIFLEVKICTFLLLVLKTFLDSYVKCFDEKKDFFIKFIAKVVPLNIRNDLPIFWVKFPFIGLL